LTSSPGGGEAGRGNAPGIFYLYGLHLPDPPPPGLRAEALRRASGRGNFWQALELSKTANLQQFQMQI
jgi:hypothetical protein